MYGLRVNIGSQYLVSKSGLKILSPHLGCFQYLVTWGLACFLLASSSRLLARASSPLTPSSKLACSEIIIMFAYGSGVNIKFVFSAIFIKLIFCLQAACLRTSSGAHGLPFQSQFFGRDLSPSHSFTTTTTTKSSPSNNLATATTDKRPWGLNVSFAIFSSS